MSTTHQETLPTTQKALQSTGWMRRIYNHNPFYVISACLVLYGLHLSFDNHAANFDCWLLLKLLSGYTLLLVMSAILIVRAGAVWEDARTIIVLVLMLLVALSACFDRVCLDNVALGSQVQLFGLLIAFSFIELLLFGIGAKLPIMYRFPLYLTMGLLFAYPVWLGHLSLTGQDIRMSWYVFIFPAAAGAALLALLPAAKNDGANESPNGTPWAWPLYPWCGLAFLAVAVGVRSYSLSVSFELARGLSSAFMPYFLIPLLLALTLILVELCLTTKLTEWANILCCLAALSFSIALPGGKMNGVQVEFLSVIQNYIGSPIQLSSVLLICFYAYCAFRRVAVAELGLFASSFVFVFCDTDTISLTGFCRPSTGLAILLGGLALLRAAQTKSSWRFLVGMCVLTAGIVDWNFFSIQSPEVVFFAVALLSWAILGLLFSDAIARFVRLTIHLFAWATSVYCLCLVCCGFRHTNTVTWGNVLLMCLLAAYWWNDRTVRRLVHILIQVAILAAFGLISRWDSIRAQFVDAKGGTWILVGLLTLSLAIALSLLKAGMVKMAGQLLESFNRQLAARLP